ncbi:MAG: radical SAM protein [Candidatus Omnitrophica bacterium]|nr:radical SAM protein [Candidatus Omnitrophota bacterium]
MDLLLIQSPFCAQGILPHTDSFTVGEGLLSICSYLDTKGYSTDIFCIDELYKDIPDKLFTRRKFFFSDKDVADRLRRANPRVIGIGALTPQYPAALKIAQISRRTCPEAVIVMGGPHVTYTDTQVFRDSAEVDIVVRGEGEWTMEEVLERVLSSESLEGVKGITYRKGDEVIRNPERPLGDLGGLPPVDYSKPNPEFMKRSRYFITTTRGCLLNCSYCVESKYWGHQVRPRSIEAVTAEIKYLVENYDNDIYFLGSVFNYPEGSFRQLCARLKQFDFGQRDTAALVGAANLPEEHIHLMKEAGVKRMLIAVESASEKVLRRMRKPITLQKVIEKCKVAVNCGMTVATFWIMGHPGETEQTARESLDAMVYLFERGLNDRQEVALFTPYPGLPIVQNAEKEGFRIIDRDLSRYSRFDEPVIELDTISHEKLCQLYKEAKEIAQFWHSSQRELFGHDLESIFKRIK